MQKFAPLLLLLVYAALPALAHIGHDPGEADLSHIIIAQNTLQAEPAQLGQATLQPGATPSPTIAQDATRITVLGYHDFSHTKKATEMLIPTDKFRKQMQAIHDLDLNVISMDDFLAWKRGEKKIEDKSILITIDDGWKSVYTDAYPILKEFGFPFTLFLYTNYIDGGSSALTTEMIEEMQKHGCSIGSHSNSHPYPGTIKAKQAKGADVFNTYMRDEMAGSRKMLEKKFGGKITSYAYPGGYFTDEMLPIATESGYEILFTVLPGKTTNSTPNFTIPRYIILGTHDYIFRNATSFKATRTSTASDGAIVQYTPHPVIPKPGDLITDRMPEITADLSNVENIDTASIVMRVAGFGKVHASYDATSKKISWKPSRRLRYSTCEVSVQWRTTETSDYEPPMTWIFRIDREAAYQP